jgi:hypothetical protein
LAVPGWKQAEFLENIPKFLRHIQGYRIGALVIRTRSGQHVFQRPLEHVLGQIDPSRSSFSCTFSDGEYEVYPVDNDAPLGGRETEYAGFLEAVANGNISGWAWDGTRPDVPIKVDICDGKELLATVAADGFRVDLQKASKGNGKHCFNYPSPARLNDGEVHSIQVKISGTKIHLIGSPKSIRYSVTEDINVPK